MEQLNRVELRGIVGNVRESQIGNLFLVTMAVATNYAYKAKDGSAVIDTTWHSVEKFFDSPQGFNRGDRVEVVGRLKIQRYMHDDGTMASSTYVVASSIKKLDEELTAEV